MEQLPLLPGPAADDGAREPSQSTLPFAEGDDRPVAFALTARARRTVAPHEVPALRVVTPAPAPGPPRAAAATVAPLPAGGPVPVDEPRPDPVDGPDEDVADTRPARARALRRAGARPATIAAQLGVDPLLVRAWTDGVGGVAHVTALPAPIADDPHAEDVARRAAFASARTTARGRARTHLAARPVLAGGLGVLAACVDVEPDGVTVTTRDPRVARATLRWVAEVLEVPAERWRTVVRLGERAAADLAVHRWAAALAVPRERVRTTRWAGTPDDVEEVRCRLADPVVAAEVAGWCDALLDDPDDDGF